jgi:hypothetical protein
MVSGMTIAELAELELAYPTYTAILGLAARRLLAASGGGETGARWHTLTATTQPGEWERREGDLGCGLQV